MYELDSSRIGVELSGGVDVDFGEKLQEEPYPRVRYFMTVSVGNPRFSLFCSVRSGDASFLVPA
jgi:hypothetical protein